MKNLMYKNDKGVTLIELLVVISIIIILSALTAIGVEAVRKERVSQVSRQLYGDLTDMRLSAMTRSPAGTNTRGYGIRVESATTYVVFRFEDADGNLQYAGIAEEADTVTKTVPNGVVLSVGAVVPNNDVLIFDRHGYSRGPAWGFLNMTIAIIHASDDAAVNMQRKCVTVSPNRIREGLWDVTTPACTVQ